MCEMGADKKKETDCQNQGLSFVPMIVEAVGGGWGKEARKVWSELAKSSAAAAGELSSTQSSVVALLRCLATTLHRENARAALRRFGHGVQSLPSAQHLSVMATVAESGT